MQEKIDIREKYNGDAAWIYTIEISNSNSKTTHEVTVLKSYYEELSNSCNSTSASPALRYGARNSPEELVKQSFKFLLTREPKESILKKFDLSIIQKYFPDYEQTMRSLLTNL